MATTAVPALVHYFDTASHRILCAAGGFELRSTKHARGVTCPTCSQLLAAKEDAGAEGDAKRTPHPPA